MKIKLASLALAVCLLTVPASAFSDVDSGQYYASPVAWAVSQGITTGTTETTFSPDSVCTKGQILTFLWRSAGAPDPQITKTPYTDVTSSLNPDFYKAILWAFETGILGSVPEDGLLSPNSPCTRGLTMSYLWRHAGSPMPHVPAAFEDVAPNSEYAMAVSWAVETGVTGGVTETQFHPEAPCTRGQIVTFLYRSLGGAFPESPVPTMTEAPEEDPEPEVRPLQTLSGTGSAYSLGLDGSAFTSGEVYESTVLAEIYSGREAVFTISVPFPLYQAWDYTVRFTSTNEENPMAYVFSYARWDEAFADMVPSWQDEASTYRLTEISGEGKSYILEVTDVEEDRMGGKTSWRVQLPDETPFRFTDAADYTLTSEVTSGFGV